MTAIDSRRARKPAFTEFDDARQPPQDLAAEQSVLGGMLLSTDAIADVLERLRPGDFYRPVHQNVYDAIVDLYGRGEPADAVTVAAELDRRGLLRRIGGAAYLHTLISTVPTAANAGYYARIVAEKALLRRLVQAGTRVVAYGYAGAEGSDVAEVVDRAQAEIYDLTDRRLSQDFVALEDLLAPTMDEIEAIASAGALARGVPTGFRELDEVTNGLHPTGTVRYQNLRNRLPKGLLCAKSTRRGRRTRSSCRSPTSATLSGWRWTPPGPMSGNINWIDPARSACLCDVGMPGYALVVAIDRDGGTDLVLADRSILGCSVHNRYDPTTPAGSPRAARPVAARWRDRVALSPWRCGRPTKTGRPCRAFVVRAGDACGWHRDAGAGR